MEEKMTAHSIFGKSLFRSVVLFFFAGAALAAMPARAQTVDEAVSAVEKHYQALTDLTARVIQKNHLKAVGKTLTFEGALLIKKPGKLRLEYTNGQLIVIDGTAALFYSKKSGELIKKTFTDFEHMNIPVAFLLGAGHIRDDFNALQPDQKDPRSLTLVPKKPGAAMKKLGLESDDSGRITRLTIFDRSGNVTELAFTDVREGVGLADALFSFTPPKGTEIIEQ